MVEKGCNHCEKPGAKLSIKKKRPYTWENNLFYSLSDMSLSVSVFIPSYSAFCTRLSGDIDTPNPSLFQECLYVFCNSGYCDVGESRTAIERTNVSTQN